MRESDNRIQDKQLMLVIESHEPLCDKIRSSLSEKYEVKFLSQADEAIDFVCVNADYISLVLLDIQTIGTGGTALLRTLKSDDVFKKIPVIVLTAGREEEILCLQIGASDVIQTPCTLCDVVLSRIRRSIKKIEINKAVPNVGEDDLTGILNQETFFRYAVKFDKNNPDLAMDAVCVDISNFHIINDLYGREAGNRILVVMAQELKKIAFENNCVICRQTADNFLIYISHRQNYESFLNRLQSALNGQYRGASAIRLKMGVYSNVDKKLDIQSRFDRAKLARDSIHYSYTQIIAYYDVEKYREDLMYQQMLHDMDSSLEERHFKVYYQPKFDIRGDRPELISAESLVRWQHPTMGLLFPVSFVPLFENNGLITKLDRYVWKESAAQVRRWIDKYGITIPVSDNVSREDLLDSDLTEFFSRIVEENNLTPNDLLLEITESAYTENLEQLIEQVDNLQSAGFRIEMDDFGSGYSSLNMLSSIPIDVIKLDINFIRNMFDSEKNMQMLKLMMQIKDSLGVPVVAEGVETKEQLDLLKEMGCDIVQGYYFSKPVPAEEFEKFIEEKIAI